MSIAYIIAGLVFLFNPHINIIDFMPDAIGYGLVLYGILRLSHVNAAMSEAASRFKTLFILALCKLPCLYVYALITPEEQTWILLLSLAFGAAEAILGFLAFSSFFTSVDALSDSARDVHIAKNFKTVKLTTLIFTVAKPVMAIFPDLTMLADDRYGVVTENGIVSLKGYRGMFNVFSFALVLLLGIVWLVMSVRYFRGMKKDTGFFEEIEAQIAIYERDDHMRPFRYLILTLSFFFYALMFCLELKIEGYSILPPMLNAVLFTIVAFLFYRFYRKTAYKKTVVTALAASISNLVLSTVSYLMALSFANAHYGEGVGGFSDDLYYRVISNFDIFDELVAITAVTALSQAAFVVMMISLYKLFAPMIEAYGGNPESTLDERDRTPEMREREAYADKTVKRALHKGKPVFLVFSLLTAISSSIFPLLQIYVNEFFMTDLVIRVVFVLITSSYIIRLKNGVRVKAGLDLD